MPQVWKVNPDTRKVYVYRSPKDVRIYDDGDGLVATDVHPKLRFPVRRLFDYKLSHKSAAAGLLRLGHNFRLACHPTEIGSRGPRWWRMPEATGAGSAAGFPEEKERVYRELAGIFQAGIPVTLIFPSTP